VRAGYCSRPSGEHKSRSPGSPEFHPADAGPPRRALPLTAAEKARRVDALRAALADSAPTFQARALQTGEGPR
jgi:hypothetical protein